MAAKKKTEKTDDTKGDEPTSSQFHDELQNTDANNHSGGNTTAPTYNDVPQAVGFDAKVAKADEN